MDGTVTLYELRGITLYEIFYHGVVFLSRNILQKIKPQPGRKGTHYEENRRDFCRFYEEL